MTKLNPPFYWSSRYEAFVDAEGNYLQMHEINNGIDSLQKRLTAAMRFVPTIEAAEAILADEDAPEEFREDAEVVKWLRGKE